MKSGKKFKWIGLLLVVALIMLSGCEAVNGLDVNKVMQNSFKVKSSQGDQTIALEIVPNAAAQSMSEQEKKAFELFSNVKLTLTDVKQQDYTHISLKGIFEYNKGKIPFQLMMVDQEYVIQIEGAKKPIIIRDNGSLQQAQKAMSPEMQSLIKQMQLKVVEWYPSLGAYLSGITPNPNTISSTSGIELIGTETTSGTKLHAEIKGSELVALTKKFITNLLADEKGLKELLGQVYDLFAPLMKQAIKESGDASKPYTDMIVPYLNNRTLAVEFAFTFITSNLARALENYDASVQAMMQSYEGDSMKVLFSDQLQFKTDLFIDSDSIARKSTSEFTLTMPADNTTSVKSIKFTSTSQIWNVNKPIQIDTIDRGAGEFEIEALNKPGYLLKALDPKSKLYELLKYDLQITKKEVHLLMNDSSGFHDSTKPYMRNGATMVPVRFVVEQLDAEVKWDEALQQVSIVDPLSDAVIKLNIGSKQAMVNGMIKPLESEAEIKNGTTFVPVRFIAESLGATVSWNQEQQMVTISRD